MSCPYVNICGGCSFRDIDYEEYCKFKEQNFLKTIEAINACNYKISSPIFIGDGCRRRATFAFEYKKSQLTLGFNQKSSHQITDIDKCALLSPKINEVLPSLRRLLIDICQSSWSEKKGKKLTKCSVSKGDIFVCQANNGLDVVLEYDCVLPLEHRMIISEYIYQIGDIIRISHRRSAFSYAETIVEKEKPFVTMGKCNVFIPAGTFLQPSEEGQKALSDLVCKYLSDIKGEIADLFCGVGTFSYVLALQNGVNITSMDSSEALLKGFQDSLNKNQITNIKIQNKNLFKYSFDNDELKKFSAIVFDPPRAGAKLLCESLAKAYDKPNFVVAVSCNPSTFVNDANTLISGGYDLQEITLVDQFAYSNHSELVAFFTKKDM